MLEKAKENLESLGEAKAQAIVNYDRALAQKIVELNDHKTFIWQGAEHKKPPSTVINKVAIGMIAEYEGLKKELAEVAYKHGIALVEAIKAEMNGLQSINKYHSDI